jgi:osmotically-inducible protein OsmY
VDVQNKVVTLTGKVESFTEKELCGDVAKSVKGVVDLNNKIDIDYQTDRPDMEIKSDVEGALKWDAMIDDGLIEVKVNNGQVELSGVVGSAAEKRNAYTTAWVAGVTSVDNDGLEVKWWAKDEELRKNKYVSRTDKEIEDAIIDAALYDPRVFSFEIQPEANNGWVILRGTVDNLKAKKAAEKLAEHTTGVTGVTNRIKVQWYDLLPPTDAEIRSEIYTALANNAITESWEIFATVNNGTATLSGEVDSYLEKMEAEWVASGVQGVSEVNNLLDVNYPHGYYWWGGYPYYNLHVTPPFSTDMNTMEIPRDHIIKRKVNNELWWSPYVDQDQVQVTVENGEVTLEGTVDSWKEYQKAAENAWEGGAWTVTNRLLVAED